MLRTPHPRSHSHGLEPISIPALALIWALSVAGGLGLVWAGLQAGEARTAHMDQREQEAFSAFRTASQEAGR